MGACLLERAVLLQLLFEALQRGVQRLALLDDNLCHTGPSLAWESHPSVSPGVERSKR
jgi:hypothetical protein